MKRLFTALILSAGIPAFAAPSEITLDDAVSAALANNRELAAAAKRAEQTKEKVNQAWGALLPVIESQASATRQHADSGFTALSDGSYDIRAIQVSLGLNPGGIYHAVKIASDENAAAREQMRRVRYQVTSDVIRGYFSIVRARQLLAIRKDSFAQLESSHRDTENLYKNGSVPRYDLLQSEVQMKNAQPLILEAETLLSVSLDAFNLTLGAPSGTYCPPQKEEPVPSVIFPSDDASVLSRMTQTAIKNSPGVIELELRRSQAKHAAAAQQSFWLWPTFTVGGNWGWNRNLANPPSTGNPAMSSALSSVFGNDSWQQTWQLRAGATYRWDTLLPFSSPHAKKREADAAREEIDLSAAQLRRSVEVSVRRDYYAMKTASLTLATRLENIATAQEGLRIARESYREGIVRSSDLLAAETALTGARGAFTDALYSFYTAMADLQKDTGVDTIRVFFEEEQK